MAQKTQKTVYLLSLVHCEDIQEESDVRDAFGSVAERPLEGQCPLGNPTCVHQSSSSEHRGLGVFREFSLCKCE